MAVDIPASTLPALLDIISQASAETDVPALADLVSRHACRLLVAERATLYVVDKAAGELQSMQPGEPDAAPIRARLHEGIPGLVAATGQPMLCNDPGADPRADRALERRTGIVARSVVCAPLTNRRGDVLGVLEVVNKREGAFTPEDLTVLGLLASQAGIALANARLYDGLRTALDRLSRLMKVGAAISSELDLDTLLRTISETTSYLLEAERSTVFLVDRANGQLWSRVAEGLEQTEIRLPLSAGIAGAVASTGASVRIDDAYTDARFNPEVDRQTGYQTRTILCVPMRNPHGDVIGVFQVLNKRAGCFTAVDEQLLSSLSSQAAVALENARLYEEVQRAYGDLQALDRMKSDFLNAISHELRTPLAPILGYAEMLGSGTLGALAPAAGRGVQAIADSGKRLLGLIESLLAFVRLDHGEMVLRREAVPLPALCRAVCEGFSRRVEERGLALVLDLPDSLPPVLADRQELTLALTHLVDNATKFTGSGGHVRVEARSVAQPGQPRLVELAVRDDGIGIAPEQQSRIFDRFYQVDGSMTRQFGGVGIGLAIVKQILDAHGSRVLVDSVPGAGATFRFHLPALE